MNTKTPTAERVEVTSLIVTDSYVRCTLELEDQCEQIMLEGEWLPYIDVIFVERVAWADRTSEEFDRFDLVPAAKSAITEMLSLS